MFLMEEALSFQNLMVAADTSIRKILRRCVKDLQKTNVFPPIEVSIKSFIDGTFYEFIWIIYIRK